MKKYILSISFSMVLSTLFAQPIPEDSLYLGQTPPGEIAKIFAPGHLVDSGRWAGERIAISADGKEIYFTEVTGGWGLPNSSAKIKYFKYENSKWNGPLLLFKNCFAPTLSTDAKTIYFSDGIDIWFSERNLVGWNPPALFGKDLYYFQTTNSGNKYVGRNNPIDGIGDWDVCSLKDTTVKSLGAPLNSTSNDAEFFIAKDESFIITSKNESSDNRDLYISFKKSDNSWTNPAELITSKTDSLAFRWGVYVTTDNKYLFYTRGTSSTTTYLYWMRFDTVLHKLRSIYVK